MRDLRHLLSGHSALCSSFIPQMLFRQMLCAHTGIQITGRCPPALTEWRSLGPGSFLAGPLPSFLFPAVARGGQPPARVPGRGYTARAGHSCLPCLPQLWGLSAGHSGSTRENPGCPQDLLLSCYPGAGRRVPSLPGLGGALQPSSPSALRPPGPHSWEERGGHLEEAGVEATEVGFWAGRPCLWF